MKSTLSSLSLSLIVVRPTFPSNPPPQAIHRTLYPMAAGNYETICEAIHGSTDKPGTLVRELAARTQVERREIRAAYKSLYGDDLPHHLKGIEGRAAGKHGRNEFSVCKPLCLWTMDPHERDAILVREALERSEADYGALTEIFAGRKSSHVLLIKQAYFASLKRQLDHDIRSLEPPHPYQKILLALSASHKAHTDGVISQDAAKSDAIRLYQTGEGSPGSATDEAVALEILSKRSIQHLKVTFSCYKRIYGHNYTKALRRKNDNQFEGALRHVVKLLYDPPKYYAKVAYMGIKGVDSDSRGTLTRVMVSRAGVDLIEIRKVFKMKYGKEMKDLIRERLPCGDYRDFLLALAALPAPS